ncbi:DUF2058 domain-containing protein [Neptunomonas japonica]|uniref:DUF2058 domain-containing protein n=1 Tax=Neptunomonas japonica TaxID=417574 RepID=UPI00040E007A|nr:DUF2058 domain-containing protein [Neptunomonas japonica]
MAISLQDQLLKAGLANKQQAKKAKAQKKKATKQDLAASSAEAQRNLENSRKEKAERDKELNKRREEEKAKKALESEARQLIEHHKIHISDKAEISYRFVDGTLIKNIYVTADLHNQLARMQLVISKLDDKYYLISAEIADRVEARQPTWLIRLKPEEQPEQDDPYAEYAIPDDLMW